MSEIPKADSLAEVAPGVFRWEVWSPRHKVELTSHACRRGDALTVFDPIPLRADLRERLTEGTRSVEVFVTSENHLRASDEWRRMEVSVQSRRASGFTADEAVAVDDRERWWNDFEIIPLAGGPVGECVLLDRERGWAFGGDAIVNLPGRQLEVLPAKYCRDQAALMASLRQLVRPDLDWYFPAHGQPIGPDAGRLIRELKGENGRKVGAHDRT